MHARSSLPTAVGLICLASLATATAHACDCLFVTNAAEAVGAFLNRSDAVFVGVIVEQERSQPGRPGFRSATFQVLQSWKGVVSTEVGIITPWDSAACGFENGVNAKLLVYATMNADEGTLATGSCSVRTFGECRNCTAEEHIAEFSQLGVEELALSDGPSTWSPPREIDILCLDGTPWAPCGAGAGLCAILSLAVLLVTPKARPASLDMGEAIAEDG